MSQLRLINKEIVVNPISSRSEIVLTIAVPTDIDGSSFDEVNSVGKQVIQFVSGRFKNRKIPALLS